MQAHSIMRTAQVRREMLHHRGASVHSGTVGVRSTVGVRDTVVDMVNGYGSFGYCN